MTETKDRAKVGRWAWLVDARTGPDESGNFEYHEGGEHYTEREAVARGVELLLAHPESYATIHRGVFVAESYDNAKYGHILDATFDEDQDWQMDGYLDADGAVQWDVSA